MSANTVNVVYWSVKSFKSYTKYNFKTTLYTCTCILLKYKKKNKRKASEIEFNLYILQCVFGQ